MNMYKSVKYLKTLLTDEEKALLRERKERWRQGNIGYDYEREGYMTRQPRLDLSKYNYNFE